MFLFTTSRIIWTSRVGLLIGLLDVNPGPVAATQPQDVSIEAHTERGCHGPAAATPTSASSTS